MSLVAGGVFWLMRAILAGFPLLAQSYPIKKWAAAGALLVGLAYMLLAGSDTATLRSYIMIAVVFFAVIADRPALSVRNLAVAALIILVITPEAAVSASFQMSFMAVMGLAGFYEYWSARRRHQDYYLKPRTPAVTLAFAVGGIVFATVITTVIAGTLSSIPAAYHFGRVAPYGILANGLAIPIVSLVVMPMALAGVLLMPLGLEAWPLWLMGKGLDLVLAVSDWVAGLPGSSLVIARQPRAGGHRYGVWRSAILLARRANPFRGAGRGGSGVANGAGRWLSGPPCRTHGGQRGIPQCRRRTGCRRCSQGSFCRRTLAARQWAGRYDQGGRNPAGLGLRPPAL